MYIYIYTHIYIYTYIYICMYTYIYIYIYFSREVEASTEDEPLWTAAQASRKARGKRAPIVTPPPSLETLAPPPPHRS